MPIYEYQCKQCQHTFDLMQKISDSPVTQCPKCSEDSAVRLVSAASFQLKGTGWYVTDFKDKGKPAEKIESKKESKDVTPTTSAESSTPKSTSEKSD